MFSNKHMDQFLRNFIALGAKNVKKVYIF